MQGLLQLEVETQAGTRSEELLALREQELAQRE